MQPSDCVIFCLTFLENGEEGTTSVKRSTKETQGVLLVNYIFGMENGMG